MTAKYGALCASVEITADNQDIIFNEGLGDMTAEIAVGTYYLYGTDSTPGSLLRALKDAFELAGAEAYDLSFFYVDPLFSQPVVAVVDVSATVTIKWADASTTFDSLLVGFPADLTLATHFGSKSPSCIWMADQYAKEDEPDRPKRNVVTHKSPNNTRSHFIAGDVDRLRRFEVEWANGDRVFQDENTAAPNVTYEQFWQDFISDGRPFKYLHAETLTLATSEEVGTYVLDNAGSFPVPRRTHRGIAKYTVGPLVFAEYVA